MKYESVYVISNVHGCYFTLASLLSKLPDKKADVCFVGDIIDRGKNSNLVINILRHKKCGEKICLGNHEDMAIMSAQTLSYHDKEKVYKFTQATEENGMWLSSGGIQTLRSYDFHEHQDFQSDNFYADIAWMKRFPLYLTYPSIRNASGRYLVVSHAAFDKTWVWSEQQRKADSEHFKSWLIWNRITEPTNQNGIYNVFGHTPVSDPIITDHSAAIDNAVWSDQPGYGRLVALKWPELTYYMEPRSHHDWCGDNTIL